VSEHFTGNPTAMLSDGTNKTICNSNVGGRGYALELSRTMRSASRVVCLTALLFAESAAFAPTKGVAFRAKALAPNKQSFLEASRFVDEEVEPTFLEGFSEGATDLLVLGLRIGTCSLMVHHGFDKIQNVDGFSANVVAKYFGFLPGPASFLTLSAAATQVAGAGLLAIGVLVRPVALSMMATMLAAVTFHLLNTGGEGFPLAVVSQHSYNFELAAMYVLVLAFFGVNGAGKYSVDEQVLGGELNLYQSGIELNLY